MCAREESQQWFLKSMKRLHSAACVFMCSLIAVPSYSGCVMELELQKKNLHPSEINQLELSILTKYVGEERSLPIANFLTENS